MLSAAPAVPHAQTCAIRDCRPKCGLGVVDQLLQATGAVKGDETDSLLDLRWLLRHRQDAEAALALFCQLRRAMEERHYLAFYRLRRWLANHIAARVTLDRGAEPEVTTIQLDWYCVEAVRHRCLASLLDKRPHGCAPRVEFFFRDLELRPTEAAPSAAACSGASSEAHEA